MSMLIALALFVGAHDRTGIVREPTRPTLTVVTYDIVCGDRPIRASYASRGGRYVDQSIFISIDGQTISGLVEANEALMGKNINGMTLISCEREVYSFIVQARTPGRYLETDRTAVGLVIENGGLRVE